MRIERRLHPPRERRKRRRFGRNHSDGRTQRLRPAQQRPGAPDGEGRLLTALCAASSAGPAIHTSPPPQSRNTLRRTKPATPAPRPAPPRGVPTRARSRRPPPRPAEPHRGSRARAGGRRHPPAARPRHAEILPQPVRDDRPPMARNPRSEQVPRRGGEARRSAAASSGQPGGPRHAIGRTQAGRQSRHGRPRPRQTRTPLPDRFGRGSTFSVTSVITARVPWLPLSSLQRSSPVTFFSTRPPEFITSPAR